MSLQRVWKYPLKPGPNKVEIHECWEFAHFGHQNGIPTMWAVINEAESKKVESLWVVPTNAEIDRDSNEYLGTAQIPVNGDEVVVHLFKNNDNE